MPDGADTGHLASDRAVNLAQVRKAVRQASVCQGLCGLLEGARAAPGRAGSPAWVVWEMNAGLNVAISILQGSLFPGHMPRANVNTCKTAGCHNARGVWGLAGSAGSRGGVGWGVGSTFRHDSTLRHHPLQQAKRPKLHLVPNEDPGPLPNVPLHREGLSPFLMALL